VPSNLNVAGSLIAGLRSRLTGWAFPPGDPGCSRACGTYNLLTPLRPRVAIGAETVTDVRAAIRFAVDSGLGVAVRGGGHIVAGQDEDIVVLNTRRLRTAPPDSSWAAATARVSAACPAGPRSTSAPLKW
jgi:FAD/FMN-containing dehydrogenase